MRLRLLTSTLLLAARLQAADGIRIERHKYAEYLPADRLTVVVTFDGSKSSKMWRDILAFSDKENIRCSFFISSVYFLSDAEKSNYTSPTGRIGYSAIGFGGSAKSIKVREALVLDAERRGHDIESHLDGHEDGEHFTREMWASEFDQFPKLCEFLPRQPEHIRFPHLSMNAAAYPILAASGIKSVTSTNAPHPDTFARVHWQEGDQTGTIDEYPIEYALTDKRYIALMDYNFYDRDLKANRTPDEAEAAMLAAYRLAAENCFKTHRPLFLSHHFSDWNKGAYWSALKKIIVEIKAKYPTDFVTVAQLHERLNPAIVTPVPVKAVPKVPLPVEDMLPKIIPQGTPRAYKGIISEGIPAYMRLVRDGLRLNGTIFYKKYGPDIALEGSIDAQGQFVFYELNDKGEYIGKLTGQAAPDAWIGTWSKPDGKTPRTFVFDRLPDVSTYDSVQTESLNRSHRRKDEFLPRVPLQSPSPENGR